MALKDLTTSKASIAEDVIEQIIADHVRYDPDEKSVVFMPEAHSLSNKAKVLIYLVALQGWSFVVDEVVPADAKPAEIEEHTGIAGGSLRPTLKELKDRNAIVEKGGRYSVRSMALPTIKAELDGSPSAPSPRRSKNRRKKSLDSDSPSNTATKERGQKKRSRGSSSGVGERFQSWIDGGFFDEPKALSDVQKRFHKEAIIVPQTSMPSYLLKGVRSGQLEREKQELNGKLVWVYKKARNT